MLRGPRRGSVWVGMGMWGGSPCTAVGRRTPTRGGMRCSTIPKMASSPTPAVIRNRIPVGSLPTHGALRSTTRPAAGSNAKVLSLVHKRFPSCVFSDPEAPQAWSARNSEGKYYVQCSQMRMASNSRAVGPGWVNTNSLPEHHTASLVKHTMGCERLEHHIHCEPSGLRICVNGASGGLTSEVGVSSWGSRHSSIQSSSAGGLSKSSASLGRNASVEAPTRNGVTRAAHSK